jgi:Holliday junction resolvase RusA-like endonuclease
MSEEPYLRVEVEGRAIAKGSYRPVPTPNGARVTSSAKGLKPWEKAIRRAATLAMGKSEIEQGAVLVYANFRIARPASVRRLHPTVAPDLDKLVRAVLDGLIGVAFRDDAQVVRLDAGKRYVPAGAEGVTIACVRIEPGLLDERAEPF